MIQIANKQTILRFYSLMNASNFETLSKERMTELDKAVDKWRYFFMHKSCGLLSLMTFTAEKMIVSNGVYGPVTPTEKMYFYLKMIDPEFYFLEAYESGNTIDQIKELCILNFRFYDPNIIRFEKSLYKVMDNLPEDMWALERIKR